MWEILLYCKIETLGGQFTNDPNPREWLCNLAYKK